MPREFTVSELAEEWAISVDAVRYQIRQAVGMAGVRTVGRTWLVSNKAVRATEEWRRRNARK